MFFFWWTGKGFLTAVIVVVTLMTFGAMRQSPEPVFESAQWFWGIALIVAGAINWFAGRQLNAKKIAAVRSLRFRDTLIYRARHKFLSLPFEFWSIPMSIGGVMMIGYSIALGSH
jgi:uncharacterized membrane protein